MGDEDKEKADVEEEVLDDSKDSDATLNSEGEHAEPTEEEADKPATKQIAVESEGGKKKKGWPQKLEKEVKNYLSTRCAPKQFKKFVDELSEERRKSVIDMGFGGLLQFNFEKNRNKEVMELMRRFDLDSRKLRVHGTELELSEGSVHWLTGLPLGEDEIKMKCAECVNIAENGNKVNEGDMKDGKNEKKQK